MGHFDSSLTRVQPVFNCLLDQDRSGTAWLEKLIHIAASTRPASTQPGSVGKLLEEETPADVTKRFGKVFERVVSPPTAFLRWLLENPEKMQVRNRESFGAQSADARTWRRQLFSAIPKERAAAQREGLTRLESAGNNGSSRKWWAFEGWSHIDCCLMTETLVLFVEGKRTESVSPSTLWFRQRSQLWRNVEAAEEFAAGKAFGVILAVENEAGGRHAVTEADANLSASYPHLPAEAQQTLSSHLLGFVTWSRLVSEFGLSQECLKEHVEPSGPSESTSPG
jgi:hypothetical protein